MRKYCLFLALLVCTVLRVDAQHPDFWSLNEESGLPSNVVYDIMEDSKGYIWIGTDKGLIRYSGQEIKTYTSPSQKSLALTGLHEDKLGRIWGVNFSRQIFYVENDSLKELEVPEPKDATGHLKIAVFGNNLYAFSYHQLDRLELNSMKWDVDFYGEQWPMTHRPGVRKMLYSIRGEEDQYALSFSSEIRLVKNNELVHQRFMTENSVYHRSSWFRGSQVLVPHGFRSLMMFDSETGDTTSIPVDHPSHSNLTRILLCVDDGRDNLWLCTSEGARNLTADSGGSHPIYFPEHQVSRVIKDREGNLWFATLQHGIQVVPNPDILVYNSQNSTLQFDQISSIGLDMRGNVLVGSFNGIAQQISKELEIGDPIDLGFRKEVNGFVNYLEDEWAFGEQFVSISNGEVKTIGRPVSIKQVESLGGNNLALLTSEGFGITDFTGPVPVIPDHWKLEGSLDYRGLSQIGDTGFRRFQKGASDTEFYLSSTRGLVYHTPNRAVELKSKIDSSIYSLDMAMDETGVLWASTVSQGVMAFKGDELHASIGSEAFGEPVQFSSIDCSNGHVWVAGSNGLYRIDSRTLEWEKFDVTDGLPSNSINDLVVTESAVWLATMKGLVRLPKDLTSINSTAPTLSFGTIKVNQNEIEDLDNLKFHENNVTFRLEPLSLRSRGSARIKYRLNGLNDRWSEVPISENEIRFLALAPGEYQFEAKLINEDGFESKVLSFQLSIAPPFWQTWWFYLLILLVVGGFISGIFLFRIREMRKRDAVQHDLRVSELTALKAQMNPHFVFNALNSIQDYVLMNQTELANDYLGKFARLMRKTLDQSQQITVSLSDELELLNLYLELEAIRFEDEFEYKVHVDEKVNGEQIEIPSMIVQPFVENAIKHGLLHKKENRKLLVDFKMAGSILECRIEDNGIGLEASRKMNESRSNTHRSFGTGAVKKRLSLLNEGRKEQISVDMKDVTNPAEGVSGTHVLLRIPIIKELENA